MRSKPAKTEVSAPWWDTNRRLRTTVVRTTPYRDDAPRPVEVAIDFPLLLERAGIPGTFDPASLRVIDGVEQTPSAYRTERHGRPWDRSQRRRS